MNLRTKRLYLFTSVFLALASVLSATGSAAGEGKASCPSQQLKVLGDDLRCRVSDQAHLLSERESRIMDCDSRLAHHQSNIEEMGCETQINYRAWNQQIAETTREAVEGNRLAEPGRLYVQTASSGAFGNGRLVLRGLVHTTHAFGDGEDGRVELLSLAEFVDFWNMAPSESQSPPRRASLVLVDTNRGIEASLILWQAESSEEKLDYAATLLEGELPESFGPAMLFIDSGPVTEAIACGNADGCLSH